MTRVETNISGIWAEAMISGTITVATISGTWAVAMISGTITVANDIDIALFPVTTTDAFYPKAHRGDEVKSAYHGAASKFK